MRARSLASARQRLRGSRASIISSQMKRKISRSATIRARKPCLTWLARIITSLDLVSQSFISKVAQRITRCSQLTTMTTIAGKASIPVQTSADQSYAKGWTLWRWSFLMTSRKNSLLLEKVVVYKQRICQEVSASTRTIDSPSRLIRSIQRMEALLLTKILFQRVQSRQQTLSEEIVRRFQMFIRGIRSEELIRLWLKLLVYLLNLKVIIF